MKKSTLKRNMAAFSALAAATVPGKAQESENAHPNIVVFIADDLLTTELGCYGGTNLATPNIDRLANEGVQFSYNFASVAMSVPIRASMYTGLYPMHHGSYQNHKGTFKGTKTVNEYMPEVGYRVGRTGKDHPGPKSVYKFDEIPGFTVGCTSKVAPYTTDGIRDWMSRNDDPFLLYVCSINTHAPWTWGDPSEFDANKLKLPENCVDTPEMREIFTHYLAEVRALDNEVGSVYQTLKEIGKLDDTVFFFLGEQGPQFPGGKWTLWYPGCHSALLCRYPAKIKPGSKSDAIVQYEDLLPTFIDIAGGEPRPELDGKSFKSALWGESKTARKYAYGIHNNYPEGHPYPIRSIRDDRYALIMNLTPDSTYHEKHLIQMKSPTGVWSAWMDAPTEDTEAQFWINRFLHRPAYEFYDLQNDPWERKNLIGEKKYAARIAEMKAELLKWMDEQGDAGASVDVPFRNAEDVVREMVNKHSRAVMVKDGWMRDPYMVLGPDNYFYLTGTTAKEDSLHARGEHYNTGLGKGSVVGNALRIWRSTDMVDWQELDVDYKLPYVAPKKGNKKNPNVLWAPELLWTGSNWLMTQCPQGYSHLAMTEGSDIRGPWKNIESADYSGMHDPSLFMDGDGSIYMTYGFNEFYVVKLKKDLSGFVGAPVKVGPSDRKIGHEGTHILKIGNKYVLIGTAWSTDIGRKGSYNLYYCTSDNVFGPYGPRQFAGRFLGHGIPYKDKRGRWWCTAFYNANVPPLDRKGINEKDLSENAQTINPQGTSIVPLEVKVLPNGDVSIRATDPAYATPGPDEVQKFSF